MVPIKATAVCESRDTEANQSSSDDLLPTVLTVFTFTLREYTQYIKPLLESVVENEIRDAPKRIRSVT